MSKELVHIEVTHEAGKPAGHIKMIATKQFKKKHPKTGFGRTSEPVEVRDLPDGKKLTVYGFNII